MKKYLLALSVGLLLSCSEDSGPQVVVVRGGGEDKPAVISFSNSQGSVQEGNSLSILLTLSKAASVTTNITIEINSTDAVGGQQYTSSPAADNNKFVLQIDQSASTVNFEVSALSDGNSNTEIVSFTIVETGNKTISIGSQAVYTLSITDAETGTDNCNPEIDGKYTSCFDTLSDDELNIVSWNIEVFDAGKISAVKEIIENMSPDVIAVQEIDEVSAFTNLGDELEGWEARVVDVSGRLDFGYLYKTCEITTFDNPVSVLKGSVEPRPAVKTTITHVNGLQVTLFNIHFKCCGVAGSEEAGRREASAKALQDHINTNFADDNVIVLGDWNDDIGDGPFDNFLLDSNFTFADKAIGNGASSQWSYPGWPSHLDHILISNELSDNLISAKTLVIDNCLSGYLNNVSDHRPVMATFDN